MSDELDSIQVRYPPPSAFTPQQKMVMAMMANMMEYKEIGLRLSIDWNTARNHAIKAGDKIPGNLPLRCKILFWSRGATIDQLTGEGWIPELRL